MATGAVTSRGRPPTTCKVCVVPQWTCPRVDLPTAPPASLSHAGGLSAGQTSCLEEDVLRRPLSGVSSHGDTPRGGRDGKEW